MSFGFPIYDPPAVADSITCPRCAVVGQVRVEHVIQGGKSYRAFECDACGHQWSVLETGEHAPSTERPDRSRTSPIQSNRR
jgi:hypothetical protein